MKSIFFEYKIKIDLKFDERYRSEMGKVLEKSEEILARKLNEAREEIRILKPYEDHVSAELSQTPLLPSFAKETSCPSES